MADKPWKQFERDIGKLVGGTRFWANSGESIDVEGPVFICQCKHVRSMSFNAMAQLAEEVAQDGRDHRKEGGIPDPKLGILCMRTRPGRGKKSKTIIVMDESVFRELFPTGGKDGHN